jgi:VWFA-related protein
MRTLLLLTVGLLVLTAVPGAAQGPGQKTYKVEIDKKTFLSAVREREGLRARFVSFQFRIYRAQDRAVTIDVPRDEIRVEEDGQPVANLEILQPQAQKLTAILAIDISGSMARHNKMEEAKKAALLFLDRLDARADAGLILFDHEIRVAEKPIRDPKQFAAHRDKLRQLIRSAEPKGGTAYLDATVEAVRMLKGITGRKVVVLMTDGVDMNSKKTLKEAIEEAQIAEVPVYTLGIGEPGKNDPVTTVLVLDRSGSMKGKADDTDTLSKIDGLKRAASRFVEMMRPNAKTTLLPFSDKVDRPEPFSADKAQMKQRIRRLEARGGTLLYDATFAGIETLVASQARGKKAVVVLTDGKDEAPGSRRSETMVIERAKEVGIPLYMLGLGQRHEIAEDVMKKMAKATGGDYFHAGSQHKLLELFETLSIELHDDGIDEKSLQALAKETGGKYTHVSKISELRFIYESLAQELQQTYKVTFASRRSSHDGTARGITVKVVRDGVQVSDEGEVDDVARGIVVPQMNHVLYLVLLVVLAALLGLPGMLRRMSRSSAEA